MSYAVVVFPDEGDSLGIIPTNWINNSKMSCLYPTVTSDYRRNKLVYSRQEPAKDWKEFQIRILKEYEKYESAKLQLKDSELASNTESECETETATRKRPREEKRIVLLGDHSSSNEDDNQDKKMKKVPAFPCPPPFTAPTTPHQFSSTSPYHSVADSRKLLPTTDIRNCEPRRSRKHKGNPQCQRLFSPTAGTSWTASQPLHVDVDDGLLLTTSSSSGSSSTTFSSELQSTQRNQEMMWEVLSQFSDKLDSIMETLKRIESRGSDSERTEDKGDWLANLPLTTGSFTDFEERLQDSPFRQEVIRFLSNVGRASGNIKSFAASIMKMVITDEVAEEYSLTEKNVTGVAKKPFIKTKLYGVLYAVCFQKFKNGEQQKFREGISDWLMQGKFRRLRKEKKVAETADLNGIDE